MEGKDYGSLLDLVKSPEFDCFSCIYELSLHGDNIGVQHFLVQKLHLYTYSEIEFFIPQLIQILLSFESESMALHDFILDHSRKYPHFCLLAFWNLQAYFYELRSEPESYSFHVVRNFINSLQNIMFNHKSLKEETPKMRENLHPALMMCASIATGICFPDLVGYSKPLVISQGKQQKSFLFKLANFHKSLTKNLTLKNKKETEYSIMETAGGSIKFNNQTEQVAVSEQPKRYSESFYYSHARSLQSSSVFGAESDAEDLHYSSDYTSDKPQVDTSNMHKHPVVSRQLVHNKATRPVSFESHSMPNLTEKAWERSLMESTITPVLSNNSTTSLSSVDNLSGQRYDSKVSLDATKTLQVNYFKKETEFMITLLNISAKLSQVPRDARLSSLRAELSVINKVMLPSQMDIPQLLPVSSNPNKRYHRILKLNVNEACVLNSAERVPFLLLIEYLSEDMDFDPSSDENKRVLYNDSVRSLPIGTDRTSMDGEIFENSEDGRSDIREADLGDISVIALSNEQAHFRAKMSKRLGIDPGCSTGIQGVPVHALANFHNAEDDSASSKWRSLTRDISAQIRIASLMLKQLEKSGQANSEQSTAIKNRIISSMKSLQDKFEVIDYQQIQEISAVHGGDQDAGERKVENDFKVGEDWATKRARIRKTSIYGHLPNWDLCSVIVKNGDDLQQEAFACQLISVVSHIWRKNNIGVWTKSMKIVVTSFNSGLVETINNALSVHSIKKTLTELSMKSGQNPKGTVASIKDYFLKVYGDEKSLKFMKAQENFARSLAAYSIICYVLQIKDRHNGNIMLDNEGHIMHIDFGFILSNSPGSVGFEAAPFKLSMEYVDVLGGAESRFFELFKELCKECFLALRKECNQLVNLVDMMQKDSSLPCFKNGPQTKVLLRQRLQLDMSDEECSAFVEHSLIGKSLGSMYTRLYDQFQLLTQGIYA